MRTLTIAEKITELQKNKLSLLIKEEEPEIIKVRLIYPRFVFVEDVFIHASLFDDNKLLEEINRIELIIVERVKNKLKQIEDGNKKRRRTENLETKKDEDLFM